jgi:chromosome segregation ATPase
MRLLALATVLLLAASHFLSCQPITFQEKENFSYEQRISKLEAERATLKEDVKNATEEIANLKKALSDVREKATSADDRSKSDDAEMDEIKWVGRGILGAVAFLVGVVITQWVSKFMATRRPRVLKASD